MSRVQVQSDGHPQETLSARTVSMKDAVEKDAAQVKNNSADMVSLRLINEHGVGSDNLP